MPQIRTGPSDGGKLLLAKRLARSPGRGGSAGSLGDSFPKLLMAHRLLFQGSSGVHQMMHKRSQAQASIRVLLCVLLFSALSTFALHRYVFAVYVIRGSSMSPT